MARLAIGFGVIGLPTCCSSALAAGVDFGHDVYPIFQRSCLECHGPQKHEGGLRLDRRADFLKGSESGPVVEPGKASSSEMIRRVSLTKGDDDVMPARGNLLNPMEIATLRRWIDEGAVWPESFKVAPHWSYVPPVRAPLPEVKLSGWARTPIDRFILSRLEREGLAPSPEADSYTLVRRVYLDLIGLPPSPAEADAFVNDHSADAYERLVDRLLASKQFGVRWARPWLDCARYADSHGFQKDDLRDLWAYRDWVVTALNQDMPFDEFTIEQLAGDLLPHATASQRIATGFNRCAPTNIEAGSDPQETRTNQILDRVNTLGMVWLGSTLACTQCHDHKFDPFTQRDYYGLFAFFNSTAIEAERSNPKVPGSIAFLGPRMKLPNATRDAEHEEVQREIDEVEKKVANRRKELAAGDAEWERATARRAATSSREEVLKIENFSSIGGATHEVLSDDSVLLSGEIPDGDTYTFSVHTTLGTVHAFRLEALTDPSLPGQGPGLGDALRPNFILQNFSASLEVSPKALAKPLKFVQAHADYSQPGYPVAAAIDASATTGWAIAPEFGKPHRAVFELDKPVTMTGKAVLKFRLVQQAGGARSIGRLRLTAVSGTPDEMTLPKAVALALERPAKRRSTKEQQVIDRYRRAKDLRYQQLISDKNRLSRQLISSAPASTLVMEELSQPRKSFILQRGNYLTPGESVEPHTPAALHPMESSHQQLNRLDLARWLVSRKNPLVARVVVNRYWAELFGHGIVTTPEDFGTKGDPPTHPQLLDWMAVEFMDNGWSVKKMLREIVLSSVYRQSSRVTSELLQRDDQNLLYARGPRFRLPAESIRDNALAISGLIDLEQGGPPVRPYQPEGIWTKVGGVAVEYTISPGDEKYRRGLYVVYKRGSPYPSFVNFDCDNRMACRVKRSRSDTPLQALTLMNDPVYVEAAKAMALRVLLDRPRVTTDERLDYAFRLALVRPPSEVERTSLRQLLEGQRKAGADDSGASQKFKGDTSLPAGIRARDYEAWYAVCTALMNLDETITKE